MSEHLGMAMAALAGLALGGFFFGGLWWSVQRGMRSRAPALWFMGSMLVRTVLVLAGFYGIGAHHWGRMVLCLAGFVLARLVMVGLTWGDRSCPVRKQEVRHAP